MADSGLNFSSIVATPTSTSWSQAYNAGKLFAVLSLEKEKGEGEEAVSGSESLGGLGKDLLSTFEQEFFTLETKDLNSIKDAILRTTSKIPSTIRCSFSCAFLSDSVLYLFVAGAGKIYLKRESKFGSIIDFSENRPDSIKSASGYLQNGDILIIETESFSKIVSLQNLADSLDHQTPSEITETLAPKVHEKDEGAAAAIIIAFKEETADIAGLTETQPEQEEKPQEEPTEEERAKEKIPQPQAFAQDMNTKELEEESGEEDIPADGKTIEERLAEKREEIEEDYVPPRSDELSFGPGVRDDIRPNRRAFLKRFQAISGLLANRRFAMSRVPRSRRSLLLVAVIIVAVILVSSALAINQRQTSRQKALFNEVYAQAESKYEEGGNLLDLNQDLANESLREAQKILSENKDKFKKGSEEEKKISALLAQVNEALGEGSAQPGTGSKEVAKSESKYLALQTDNNSNHFTQDTNFVYFVSSDGVARIDKGNDEEETIIEKDFGSVGGLGIYTSNVYVVDKDDDSIVKFSESEGEFTEGTYLAEGQEADFSKATSMAIDGSIYILSSDGSIKKYLRGTEQSFEVTGLKKALSGPSKIWTERDIDNIYILDKGNSRVVVINKEGAFQSEYSSSLIKNAKDFEVLEADKKVFVLSGGKIYQIDLK